MPWPGFDRKSLVDPGTRQNLVNFEALLQGYLHVEHHEDGSHADVTADSVTIKGNTAEIGTWTVPDFNAANFSGSSAMTWTVASAGVTSFAYMQIGNTLALAYWVSGTVGGTRNATLQITLPLSLFSARSVKPSLIWVSDNGTVTSGVQEVAAFSPYVKISRLDGTTWSAGTAIVSGLCLIDCVAQGAAAQSSPAGTAVSASGGTITHVGSRTIHTFTANGTFTVAVGGLVDYLVVGGGGGGGSQGGLGGGGGQVNISSVTVAALAYTITIGPGGAAGGAAASGSAGTASSFDTLSSAAGGAGGSVGTFTAPELVQNPDFTGNASGWSLGFSWAYGSNNVVCGGAIPGTLSNPATQNGGMVAGKSYHVIVTLDSGGTEAGQHITLNVGGTHVDTFASTDVGTFTYDITAADASGVLFFGAQHDYNGVVSGVSVKENNYPSVGANGAAGLQSSLSGSVANYGWGGGGGGHDTAGTGGPGGDGVGGVNTVAATAGTANTGDGGGGAYSASAGKAAAGGSGIVIISYPT